MKVSVITACYNSARTIGDAIRSVARQSYADIEHIVVDGGSTDGTLQLVSEHSGSIAKLITGPDKGIYDALNKGVAASTGDLIGLLHSDDVYASEEVISDVVNEAQRHSLEAIYGDVVFVANDDSSRVIRRYSSRRFSPSRLAWGWMPAHPGLFVSKQLYRDFGPFKTNYKIAGDFEFIARIFSKPNIRYRYIPKVFVKMRMGGISTRGLQSTWTINREMLRACRENGIRSNYFKLLSRYPAKALEFLMPSA